MMEPIKQLAETKVKNEEDKNEILAMIIGRSEMVDNYQC